MQRRRGVLLAGAGLGFLPWSGCTAVAAPGRPLTALTADDFRGARQRGVGFGLLAAGERSAADHDALAALGARHVRIWVEPVRDAGGLSYRVPAQQFATLDATLTALEARGVYLVLAASFGPDARDELWRSAGLMDSVVKVWEQLARHLRGRAAVAGFDIVNEPVPPGITYAVRQDRWLELASRVVVAVRAIDPTRVLIVESAPDATPQSFDNMRPLPYPNLVYSLHSYNPIEFTHQNVMPEFKRPLRFDEANERGVSPAQALADSLKHVVRFTQRHDVPIWVGEFSVPRWAPGDSAARYVADSIAQFNRYGWSWTYHEFRTWHGWDPEMASPLESNQQRSADAPVLRALRAGLRAPAG